MEPRHVLNDFESFVSVQRMDLLRQKILEMPNNDTNAWKMHRPVAYSATDYCGSQGDIFGNEEHGVVETPYSADYSSAATIRNDVTDFKPDRLRSVQAQYQPNQQFQTSSMQSYHIPEEATSSFARTNPTLRNFYSDMSFGHGAINYTNSLNGQNYGQNYTAAVFTTSGMNTPVAAIAPRLPQSYISSVEGLTWIPDTSFGSNRTRSSPACTDYSPATSSPNQPLLGLENLNIHGNDGSPIIPIRWSDDLGNQNQDLYTTIYGDGRVSGGQVNYNRSQSDVRLTSSSANAVKWPSELGGEVKTISPKALRINMSNTPLSSSGSSQDLASAWSGYHNEEAVEVPISRTLAVDGLPGREQQRHRRLLPDSTLPSQGVILTVASGEYMPDRSIRKSTRRSIHQEHRKASPSPIHANVGEKMSHELETPSRSPSRCQSTEGEYSPNMRTPSWTPIDNSPANATHQRNPQDEYLVRSKLAGMSYKDIKKNGKFREAESTLRGRFRTLTKAKSARVRKPEWSENDDRLLKKAVRKLTPHGDKRKAPWKQVAAYIAENGGSYHFGNATCRKRWDELYGYA